METIEMETVELWDSQITKPTQAQRILRMLEKAGDKGVTNYDLVPIALRYSARIDDLRNEGHNIKSSHIKGSLWRFVLVQS